MKTQSMLLAALASAPGVLAHTVFTGFYVDGKPQGDGVAMRMSPYADRAGSPIASLSSDDMACNVGGTKGVSRVQPVNDGARLTFEIRSWADDASKEPLDRGHKGPCAVYLKKVASAIDDKGAGDGWFKLWDAGYNADTKRWCTDEIIDNKGLLSVDLPKGLEGGYYLARPEILALHAANAGDPQFYTGCAQIFLQSSGNLVPESTVSIPGYVQNNQPATSFDIYNTDNAKYTLPGPKIATLTPSGVQTGSTQTTQTEGLKPEGCIVENANWCGKEVPSYQNSEKGCWAASEDCWKQADACYKSAPPTGNAGCELWSTKCTDLGQSCTDKMFTGPPPSKAVTPEKKAIDVGLVMPTQGGGAVDSTPKTSVVKSATSKAEVPAKSTPAVVASKEAGKKDNVQTATPVETSAVETPVTKPATSANIPAAKSSTSADVPAGKPTPSDSSYNAKPAPENKNKDTKSDETKKPVPSSYNTKPDNKDDTKYDEVKKPVPSASSVLAKPNTNEPVHTITVAPSSTGNAPAPTKGPDASCPKGWKCVTEVEVVTEYVTVTMAYDGYKKRSGGLRGRRHAMHL